MTARKDRDISNTFYVLRMFAIISVAAAHMGSFMNEPAEKIRAMLGTIGVPIFLICSGYYFSPVIGVKDFFLRHKKVIVPYFILGTFTWVLEIMRGGYTFGLFRWICGYLTWLYYVPILICFYLIFQVRISKRYAIFWICIFIVSWALTYFGVIVPDNGVYTYYQVPFNNVGFFAIGIILQHAELERIFNCKLSYKGVVITIFIIVSVLYFRSGVIGYWANLLSVPFEVMAFFGLFIVAYHLRNVELFCNIGKRTYFIFFIHMQIGMYIVYKTLIMLKVRYLLSEYVQVLIIPILIVLVTYFLGKIVSTIMRIFKIDGISWLIAL